MKVIRYDGVECEITLDNPLVTMYDKVRTETLIKGKCSICQVCWFQTTPEGRYICLYGGPFKGYINV